MTMRITSIEQPPRKKRFEVRADYAMVVSLSPEIFVQAGLRPGQKISIEQLKALEAKETRHEALAAALRLLAYRPRSEKEMRDNLRRRNTPPEVVDETLARLRELRLLDDAEFAKSYVDLRDRSSPRGRRLLAAELKAKGVDRQAIGGPLAEVDEADAAYRAAAKRARTMTAAAFPDFQRKLGDYLLRRGFAYDVARATVRLLWEELRPGVETSEPVPEYP